jgi:hypothetical protein
MDTPDVVLSCQTFQSHVYIQHLGPRVKDKRNNHADFSHVSEEFYSCDPTEKRDIRCSSKEQLKFFYYLYFHNVPLFCK